MGSVNTIHVTEGMKFILLLAILYCGKNCASSAVVFNLNRHSGVLAASGSITLLASTSSSSNIYWQYTDGTSWRPTISTAWPGMTPTLDFLLIGLEMRIEGGIQATLTGGGLVNPINFLYDETFLIGSDYFGFLRYSGEYDYPAITAGAVMAMSGIAVIEDDYLSVLDPIPNETFVSTYNGQTITLIVAPEPSIVFFSLLGMQSCLLRRKRN